MPVALEELLREPAFHLRLLVEPPDRRTLARPIAWAHSSDLPDPTPWLEPGQLLLTDGAHFADRTDDAFAVEYVRRLVEADVLALGFATEILHAAVPAELVAACRAAGLPLLEVADRTPFMAIIRHIADARELERRQRLERSLEAHRAVARAALRPDGLRAILDELERRLDAWVVLLDPAGLPLDAPRTAMPDAVRDDVVAAVRQAMGRGLRAAIRVDSPAGAFTVQTIGRRGALRAALAVGGDAPLDRAETDLITSVIALASIALEQTSELDGAREALRRALLELLLSGEVEVARRTAAQLAIPVPRGSAVRVLAVPAEPGGGAVIARAGGLAVRRDDRVVLLVEERRSDAAVRVLTDAGLSAAVSEAVPWSALAEALRQAEWLLRQGVPAGTARSFGDEADRGLHGLLVRGDGALVAAALLAPATRDEEGRQLLESARVWLQHNGAFEPAARELGVHRHTLRARMAQLGRLLGLDLDRFADRAELFSAMRLLPPV
ncbi:PucR family transcriptional regulator ligand-binding domain-containing protein [Amnibacterium kyonggiense]|uniref:PucR family transcriptional regulator ligand-binding domain-containing protein n=1 Tax=Amnibacterium kyonggiense TaxID=595671 RepID=UPI00105BCED5|nr:PucR family transcriptional regulator ligand-binding domain-containing protein [Amnibacterium kyonggiense]